MQQIIPHIANQLAHIFNKSLQTDIAPDKLKIAKVIKYSRKKGLRAPPEINLLSVPLDVKQMRRNRKPLETGRAIYHATERYDSVQCSAVFQLLRRGPWGN